MFVIFSSDVWQMFRNMSKDPTAQVAVLVVFFTALILPLAVGYVWKLWRRLEALSTENIYEKENDAEFDEYIGRFNKDLLKGLKMVNLDGEPEDPNGKNNNYGNEKDDEEDYAEMVELEETETTKFGFSKTSLAEESTRIADLLNTCAVSNGGIPKPGSPTDKDTEDLLKNLSQQGLHGKLATAQLHSKTQKIEKSMTDDERAKEREIRNQQLNSIFMMMQAQGEKFGVNNKEDLIDQMKLYSV